MLGRNYIGPTQTTAPVANTTAGLWTFPDGVHGLFLKNTSGQTITIAFNGTTASATTFDYELANNGTLHASAEDLGVGVFNTVTVWFPTSSTVTNFVIRGA